ncbi:MAG: hypothetical protein WBP18_07985 [Paracoccaceae bacterium]
MSPPAPLLRADLDASVAALHAIDAATEYGLDHDMMLAPGNAQGEALNIGAVDGLVAQAKSIERAVAVPGLSKIAFEGSDSLDAPSAVFQ